MKGKLHGGSGRIGKVSMRTMSLLETGASTGVVSLNSMFEGTFKNIATGEEKLDRLIELVKMFG